MATQLFGRAAQIPKGAGQNSLSVKGTATDPVTGQLVELIWVISADSPLDDPLRCNPPAYRLDRIRSLALSDPDRAIDDIANAMNYCRHGAGFAPAAPQLAVQALVDVRHVALISPVAVMAIALSVDGETLTNDVFAGEIGWIPFQSLSLRVAQSVESTRRGDPHLRGCIIESRCAVVWGDTDKSVTANASWLTDKATTYFAQRSKRNRTAHLLGQQHPQLRNSKALMEFSPHIRGLIAARREAPGPVAHLDDSATVLELMEGTDWADFATLASHLTDADGSAPQVLLCDVPSAAGTEAVLRRLAELAIEDPRPPNLVLLPGVGMLAYGSTKRAARALAANFLGAVEVVRLAESASSCSPIRNPLVWAPGLRQQAASNVPRHLVGRIALVTGGASGIGRATARRLASEGACVVIADVDEKGVLTAAAEIGTEDIVVGVAADVADEESVRNAVSTAVLTYGGLDLVVNCAGLSLSNPLLETSEDEFDLHHRVLAKGSFLVSKAGAQVMIDQGMGGDIIYICSKNSVVAGASNIAYSAAKASQAHQVRLLAVELGRYGIKVNGINPDGVVRGSGIFAGGWGASRAAFYGVDERDLGEYYAGRTLLKREVLPEHVANAVFVLCGPDLAHTTGTHLPVDSGVPAAFLR